MLQFTGRSKANDIAGYHFDTTTPKQPRLKMRDRRLRTVAAARDRYAGEELR